MAFLTLRARRFVVQAATMPENAALRDAWGAWQREHPPTEVPVELTPEAATMVAAILRPMQDRILRLIQEKALGEDDLADAENDLSFLSAIDRGMSGQVAA